MAWIYGDQNGAPIRWLQNAEDMAEYGPPPVFANVIEFDEATNATLTQQLMSDWRNFTMPGGVLMHNGQAVTINAAGQDYQTESYIRQAIALFKGTETLPGNAVIQAAFQAVQSGSATALQVQIVSAVTTRALGWLAGKLLANGVL